MYENVELTLICMYQVAVVIKDREYVDSYMDSKPWQAGKFAHSLRMSLWREHLGLQQSEVSFCFFLSSAYDLFVSFVCPPEFFYCSFFAALSADEFVN